MFQHFDQYIPKLYHYLHTYFVRHESPFDTRSIAIVIKIVIYQELKGANLSLSFVIEIVKSCSKKYNFKVQVKIFLMFKFKSIFNSGLFF